MAIRRTATQKSHTEDNQQLSLTYKLPAEVRRAARAATAAGSTAEETKQTKASGSDFFGYPVQLIYGDIVKTLIVTAVTMAILAVFVISGRFS